MAKDKKKHKYVAKIEKNKKTRYFYTREEWLAYLKGDKKASDPKRFINNTKSGKDAFSKFVKKLETSSNNIKSSSSERAKAETAEVPKKFAENVTKMASDVISAIKSETQVSKGERYTKSKLDENLNFAIFLPTKLVDDVIDSVKELFDKDDEKEGSEQEQTVNPVEIPSEIEPIDEDKDEEDEKIPEWAENLELIDEELTHEENQALINPEYDPYNEAYSMNCAYCTAAYDLRMRGYDVEANAFDPYTYDANMESIASWYEDTTYDDWTVAESGLVYDPSKRMLVNVPREDMLDSTAQALNEMPDGSYGQFCVFWTEGGGHSMVWEREGGETVIRDCQSNETFTYDDWVDYYGDWTYAAGILRTDNREPTENILKTVHNREDD